MVEVLLDGTHVGGVGLPGGDSADEVVAALADALQQVFLDEFAGGGWPQSPSGEHKHFSLRPMNPAETRSALLKSKNNAESSSPRALPIALARPAAVVAP